MMRLHRRAKCKKVLVVIAAVVCIIFISKFEHTLDQFPENTCEAFQLPLDSFGLASVGELERTVPDSMSWPLLRGYDDWTVTADYNPPDPLLLYRIKIADRQAKYPLLRIKKNGAALERHPWKFERIIHQSWIDENIPSQTAPWVKRWLELHPGWTYILWTDKSSRAFLERHFPTLIPAYDSWTMPVQRADMFRYVALYAFGGVYADLDMEALRSLETVREWSSCVLSREPDIQTYLMANNLNCWANNWTYTCNAFMACRSHHPFLHYLISRTFVRNPLLTGRDCPLLNVLICTGPTMVSFAYAFYRRSVSEEVRRTQRQYDVVCPDYKWFMPTYDDSRTSNLKRKCFFSHFLVDRQQKLCALFRAIENVPFSYSYTTHHSLHSYHPGFAINTRQHIMTVTKYLLWTSSNTQDFVVEHVGA